MNILVARIAWACRVEQRMGQDGKKVDVPPYDYVEGFNVQPKPFAFDLKARSEERWEMVQKEWENVRRNDPLKGSRVRAL
jgi:hypothetical protein